jgi:hypothetical protein
MVVHGYFRQKYVLAFGTIENGRSWHFQLKWAFTPYMFPCHRSHSWISGGDHFLVKNPYVLAFGIIENGHSWYFRQKWGLCGH